MSGGNDYRWDVFLSYRRRLPVAPWVEDYFYPLLQQWLNEELENDADIFLAPQSISDGTHWPDFLEHALVRSRCLVPIWSPTYFRSEWCVAEWQTMASREQLLGYGSADRPRLVHPVRFHDGDNFPPETKQIQQRDLRSLNAVKRRDSEEYELLIKEIKSMCVSLADTIRRAPAWSADFPVVRPPVAPVPIVPLTRL